MSPFSLSVALLGMVLGAQKAGKLQGGGHGEPSFYRGPIHCPVKATQLPSMTSCSDPFFCFLMCKCVEHV
eukprot:6243895-Amphidinium_carterae.1